MVKELIILGCICLNLAVFSGMSNTDHPDGGGSKLLWNVFS